MLYLVRLIMKIYLVKICSGTRQQRTFQRFHRHIVYHRWQRPTKHKQCANRSNESSISLRSFHQIFERSDHGRGRLTNAGVVEILRGDKKKKAKWIKRSIVTENRDWTVVSKSREQIVVRTNHESRLVTKPLSVLINILLNKTAQIYHLPEKCTFSEK